MQLFSNNGSSLLAVSCDDNQPNITVNTGTGDLFPVVTAGDYCMITIENTLGEYEIMKVTSRPAASDVLIVERDQEGTAGQSFTAGARVELRTTKGTMEHLLQRDGDTIDGGTF